MAGRRFLFNKFSLKNRKKVGWIPTWKLQSKVVEGYSTNIIAIKGTCVNLAPTASIVLGTGRVILNDRWSEKDPFPTLFCMREDSKLIIHGSFSFYSNADISVNENATLEIGSGFANHGARIHCFDRISIGVGVYLGEEVFIRDSDGHEIVGTEKPMTLPIVIKDHVWIGARVTIVKGVTIGEGAVVAAGAVVTKDIPPHTMVAGVPAKVVKENVTWK